MHQDLVRHVVEELRTTLTGRYLGKIIQLTPLSFAFDFGLRGSFLYVSVDPSSPRLYLIERRARDLQKASIQLTYFGQLLRARTNGCALVSVAKEPLDRIVRLTFRCEDESGAIHFCRLVIQLTGRTANLFLLDELNRIITALRSPKGQLPGEIYSPPEAPEHSGEQSASIIGSPSSHADAYFNEIDTTKTFDSRASAVRSRLRSLIQRQRKLKQNLSKDLVDHGDPEEHKKTGDLLLANIATAVRDGGKVFLTDYYSEDAPQIEIQVDENTSLQDEATRRFRLYTKAKHAREEVVGRLANVDREIAQLEKRAADLEHIINQRDAEALESFDKSPAKTAPKSRAGAETKTISGVRRYLSTDGYEVLVGRSSRDNDTLTFRIAHPNDLWLHAGDYPGSHVVVRNPTRKEIPHRTLIEAAQLAGKFSQASEDAKVVIHYTERKFLSKPKGAAPGLVRLSRFRSITVEPKEAISRL
ncbi:MAG TPA: NFACT RNA binding domain-containing protein [Pyrinomonadaceae bacterium]|nr:NFACT RNA binding domain-containing protein [Pyrinomonadaceae bacterium]